MTRYSKKIITKTIVDEEKQVTRKYQLNKLSAYEVNMEGMKLARAIMPSAGSIIDSFMKGEDVEASMLDVPQQTFSGALFFLSENFQDDQYAILVDKILGSMMVDGKEVDDWSDHFDEYPEEFFEILLWAGRESFENFFMGSTMLAPLKEKLKEIFPKVKEMLNGVQTSKETESSEKS